MRRQAVSGKAKLCCAHSYEMGEKQKQHMQKEQNMCPGSERWELPGLPAVEFLITLQSGLCVSLQENPLICEYMLARGGIYSL